MEQQQGETLQRGLKDLYIQLIALGGTVGAGLSLGSASVIQVANALNVVILTAALSVYNSCVYCNNLMLFGLAQQGNAPKALLKVNSRGVPVISILFSTLVTGLCVLLNYLMPGEAFGLLMAPFMLR